MRRSAISGTTWAMLALLLGAGAGAAPAQDVHSRETKPVAIARQGSFFAGGTVITTANGQLFHGDHTYVQYQIPPNARDLPLVMWHGGGQSAKSWESTPDGREGFQTIFLRRGFAVYILDQPRMGRAGRGTVGATLTPVGNAATVWNIFRLGIYPDFYPNVQFPRDPVSVDQFLRQQTPSTGPLDRTVETDAVAAAFDRIGPAVLLTHSASGIYGWLTAIKSQNVKAVIAYEPTSVVFPAGKVPPPIPLFGGGSFPAGTEVTAADFEKLTRIPIQIVFGDNIPTEPSPPPVTSLDLQRAFRIAADLFAATVNAHGGDASVLRLPEVGLVGNTHFAFSDLNNLQVADLLSHYLHEKRLDKRTKKDFEEH
jgi:hypothetical protein